MLFYFFRTNRPKSSRCLPQISPAFLFKLYITGLLRRFLLDGPGVGGILAVLHACLDLKNTILDKLHYVLYFLTPAMHPRYLALIDEAGKLVKV